MSSDASPKSTLANIFTSVGIFIVGGLVGFLISIFEWRGTVDAKLRMLEDRANEDRQTLQYIRTQNEVAGKDLAAIKLLLQVGDTDQEIKRRKGR